LLRYDFDKLLWMSIIIADGIGNSFIILVNIMMIWSEGGLIRMTFSDINFVMW